LTEHEQLAAQARKSALSVALVLSVIALWNLWQDRPHVWMPMASVASLLLLVGLFWRAGALAFHYGWMRFAHALGYVNSRIILSLTFYGMMTPVGLVSRLVGRNPLLRRGANRETYWIPRKHPRQPREQFERLF
jgi:Saxitoxin biosynthesis operon protein SxtJ